ncbi:hypothetical protein PR048_022764, partial [Dryococelus australis]
MITLWPVKGVSATVYHNVLSQSRSCLGSMFEVPTEVRVEKRGVLCDPRKLLPREHALPPTSSAGNTFDTSALALLSVGLFASQALLFRGSARLPPRRTGLNPRAGSPDFRKWESCRTMPLVGGFSQGYLPFPPLLHSGAAPYSLQSPSSALKISLLRDAQISSIFSGGDWVPKFEDPILG